MVHLKINENLIIDESDVEKLIKKIKDINKNKELVLGLLVIEYYLAEEWYIPGITINYLKEELKKYLRLLKPALKFIEENAKTSKETISFLNMKGFKVKFHNTLE